MKESFSALCLLSLALQVTAIATDSWSHTTGSVKGMNGDLHMGLWKACGTLTKGIYEVDGCVHLPPNNASWFPKNSLYAVQALSITGVILLFLTLLMITYKKQSLNRRALMFLVLLSAACSVTAYVVWAAEFMKNFGPKSMRINLKPGYSYYVGGAGVLLSVLCGAMCCKV
jgi:hypothetical protein